MVLQVEDQYQEEYSEEEEDQGNDDVYLTLISLNLTNQIPLETFAKNVDGSRFGLGLSYYNNFSKKDDFFWAIHFSNFRIDRLTNTVLVPAFPAGYELNLRTKTSLIFLGYGLRYYPDFYTPSFEPFLEIRLGGNYVYTYTSETINDSEESDLNFHNSDFSFAYAIGLGLQYNVRQGQALHFILNYNGGTSASYFIDEETGFEYPIDNFVRRPTQLNYLQIAVGFTFGF